MLRIGLVGLGYWGPNYARVIQELPQTQLVAVCDVSEEALELSRLRYAEVRSTSDPEAVITAEDVDAVVVATPTSTHYALARAALDAGKHVLCEKPLAETVAQCDDLIEAAAQAGRTLFVGHTFIFNPAVRQMRELIDRGEIGRLLYVHSTRTGLGPIRSDVNALWDLAPHDLSILFHLVGRDPVSVSAIGRSYVQPTVEDVTFLHLRFEDGALGAVHVSWLDPYKVRRVTVVGSERMLVFDDVAADEKLKIFDRGASYDAVSEQARGTEFGEFKAVIRDGDIHVPRVAPTEPLKDQVAHFADCCITGKRPETDGVAGRRVVAVLEAASEALRLDRAVPVAPLTVTA